jgi:hypothetical protein
MSALVKSGTIAILLVGLHAASFGHNPGVIDEDYNNGTISLTEKLSYKAMMLCEPESLPPKYRIDRPLKDGTLLMLDLRANWDHADSEFKEQFSFLLTRVSKQAFFDSPGGYFRVHYDTTGGHAVYQPDVDVDPQDGVPDFVNRTAEYFDRSWFYICDTLGYDTPPYDGQNGGGENLYDVYMHRYAGAYGVTFAESPSSQRPGRNYDYTSYIYVDPTYDGFGYNDRTLPMKVTSAHEFFHAVQFAYDINAGGWYMENCATWMEDIIWDDINDNYMYLSYFLNFVHLPLNTANGGFEYGAFLWPMFIYENWGHELIRQSWIYSVNSNAMYALELLFEENGTFLEEQYFDYSLWNYLTNYRDDGNHYEEGAYYSLARTMRTHDSYPVENMSSYLDPTALGCNYILFYSTGEEENLRLLFDGDDDDIWYLQIIKAVSNSQHTYDIFELDGFNDGEYLIENFAQYQWVAVITDIVYGASGDYIYSAYSEPMGIDGSPEETPRDFAVLGNYPNPFNGKTILSLYSPGRESVILGIYDIGGREISTREIELSPGLNQVIVNLSDPQHGTSASGVYYYRIEADRGIHTGNMLYLK